MFRVPRALASTCSQLILNSFSTTSSPLGFLANPLRGLLLVIRIPSTQGTPPRHRVIRSPHHPRLIQRLVDILVRTDDVELTLLHLLVPVVRHLTWQPRTLWLHLRSLRVRNWPLVSRQAREGPAGDEEVGGHVRCMGGRAGRAKEMRELLGERLDGRLGRVVRRVAGRVGDSLLGAREDDGGGTGGFLDHGQEGGEAVDDAEEVGGHRVLKVRDVFPGL